MKIKEIRETGGFASEKQSRVTEIKEGEPIPPGAFRVADETPVTDWTTEER